MSRSRRFSTAVTTALLVASTTLSGAAQTPPAAGTVAGRVTLQGRTEPAHGATIIIVGARRQTTTDTEGRFEIGNVPAGSYEVIAQREHFTAARQTVQVVAGQTASLQFTLSFEALHEEVTVTASATGASTTFESFNAITSLDSLELAKNRGATITDALANQPGIAARSFGAGSSRPIIRGFDGDRVLIMQDGVRTGDLSSQSGDHGVSIDPASLERLEVVKGPATLLYGSNAIGGVVNAITPQESFRAAPFSGLLGSASVDAGSANGQGGGSANVQYGRGSWTAWGGGGARRTGDYDTPIGAVANSGTELMTGRFGLGWTGPRAFFSVGTQFEGSRFGIPFAGEFHHHEGEEEEGGEHEEEALEVDIKSRRRDIRFDTGLRNLPNAFVDNLKFLVAYTDYGHDEIEVEGGAEAIGTTFSNNTATVRVELEQKRRGRLNGRLGVEWFGRDFEAVGEEALAPATTQSSIAGFAYQELDFGRYRLQFGGRLERNAYEVGARPAHEHEGEEAEEEHEAPPVRDRSFVGASGSAGIHADLGLRSAFVVNLTAASRAPALEELYNFGPHVGNLAFEIGNPDLDLERTVGIDLSLRTRLDRFRAEVGVFSYRIDNFVFLDFTGEEADGLREAIFLQGDSRFTGFEASANLDLARGAHLHGGLSYVSAKLTGSDEFLPRIPPFSGRIELEVPVRGVVLGPELVFRAAQDHVFRDETRTDGSVVLNFGASYFLLRGHATHAVAFKAFNLTNEEYRVHTSFIKDLAPEIGRGVRLTYSIRFF